MVDEMMERLASYANEHGAESVAESARRLALGSETLRKWVRQAEVDAGERAGATREEHAEIVRLKRELRPWRSVRSLIASPSPSEVLVGPAPVGQAAAPRLASWKQRNRHCREPVRLVANLKLCPLPPFCFVVGIGSARVFIICRRPVIASHGEAPERTLRSSCRPCNPVPCRASLPNPASRRQLWHASCE